MAGPVFRQRFSILRPLGAGEASRVFLAEDRWRDQARVALKILDRPDRDQLAAFRAEYARARRLRHPGLAAVHCLGAWDADGRLWLSSDYVEGESLATWARGRPSGEVARALTRAARTVAYLHACGVVHGDIKPAHLLLPEGDADRACLVDLGLASSSDDITERIAGTPGFIAPEVLRGGLRTPAADLFALAATALTALGGEPPELNRAATATPEAWGTWLEAQVERTPELGEVLRTGLALAPEERPSATAWADALERTANLRAEDGPPPLAATFVSREAELARLAERFAEVAGRRARGPQVVAIAGAPGVGKSRLVDELATLVQLGGGVVIGGARHSTADPLDVVREQLATVTVTVTVTPSHASDADPLTGALHAAVEGIAALAADVPLMVWLDELGPEDLLSRRLVAAAVGEAEALRFAPDAERAPWILCVTARDAVDLLAVEAGSPAERFELPPFDLDATTALARAAVAPVRVDDEACARLQALSGGTPELIIAALQALRPARILGGDLPAVLSELPDDARALARLRLRELSPAQRDLLTALACFDEPVADAHLGLLGAAPTAAEVEQLRRHGLLSQTPAAGGPRQWLAGELWRQQLRTDDGEERLRRRHRAIADQLAVPQTNAEQARLGVQLLEAGDVDAGARHLLAAAKAMRTAFPRDARALVRRLAALAPTGEHRLQTLRLAAGLDLALGEPSATAGFCTVANESGEAADRVDWVRALAEQGEYDRALELLRGADGGAAGLEARLLVHLGRYDEAAELARVALPRCDASEQAERAALHNAAGLAAHYRGDLAAAEAALRLALEQAIGAADRRLAASVQSSLGLVLQERGNRRGAAEMYEASLTTVRQLGDRAREAARLLNLGTLHQDAGEWQQALERYRAGLDVAARQRARRVVVRLGYNLANLLVALGALDEAGRVATEARGHAEALATRLDVAFLWLVMAEIANLRLDPRRAEEALAQSTAAAPEHDNVVLVRDTTVQAAEAALLRRDFVAARVGLNALAEPEPVARLLAARVELDDPDGDLERAAEALAQAAGPTLPGSLTWRHQALSCRLAARRGDGADAALQAQRVEVALAAHQASLPSAYRGSFLEVPAVAAALREVRAQAGTAAQLAAPETSARAPRWQRILQINRRLGRQLELKPLLELILDEALDLTEAERGFVLIDEGDRLVVQAARHLDVQNLKTPETKLSHSVARQVIESGQAVVTVDAMDDDRFRAQVSVSALRLRSIACVPLIVDERVAGALYLDNRFRTRAFDEEVVEVLAAFADQAAIAMSHARLRLALLERQGELETSREELARVNAEVQRVNEILRLQVDATTERLTEATEQLSRQRDELSLRYRYADIVGTSAAMGQVLSLVDRLARTLLPVFVHGESGTGKELVARAIHYAGLRSEGPFVAINCAAIPETLLESELFGHKRGAFTGAIADRRGLFALADGGTLFLDEIGDMPISMQAKLLRVLEEKAYRQLGGQDVLHTDVRVVSASNKDLAGLVAERIFREDLFYRLNTATIRLPPLRERAGDLPLLVRHLLARSAAETGLDSPARITAAALHALGGYTWPGNVRELDNELRRAAALSEGTIDVGHLSARVASLGLPPAPFDRGGKLRAAVADCERRVIAATLNTHAGDTSAAAEALGISRAVFYKKLKRHKLGLPKRQRRDTT